jgi:guanylate kinase
MSSERPRRGLLLVISSPSGAGKTSLTRRLLADHADLTLSISMTTRAPRPGESDGREYHFISREAFRRMVDAGDFLEWAEVHEHFYGTPKAPVLEALAAGLDVIFDIDWQGARSIAAAAPEDVARVFVLPPSMEDLSRRLHARAQDDEAVIRRRLGRSKGEIAMWEEYDYVIVNDDFDGAYVELVHVYHAERLRRVRNPWLSAFVEDLISQALDA